MKSNGHYRRSLRKGMAVTFAAALMSVATFAHAGELKVGMSTALSGPAEALGQGVRLGVDAYFHSVNEAGGVNGHTLQLVALDDGYEPKRAAPNTRQLADEGVVAFIGNVGTPTAIVTVPIANEVKTLLFGAFTGAGVLRKDPPDRYVINYRASYAEETAAMVGGLLEAGIRPEEIAFFTQNDGYGDAGYSGAVKALEANGFSGAGQLAHGRYERNTKNVEEGLLTILGASVEPRAIIMVGAYGPCAEFIKLARQDLPEAVFLNVSFVGSQALKEALGEDGEGVIITQVVPHFDSDLAGVEAYRKDLAAFDESAQPGFVSLEGYLAARIFVEGLRRIEGEVSREKVVDALESLNELDIGIGVPISFSSVNHQASHKVWPTMIRGGGFATLDWSEL